MAHVKAHTEQLVTLTITLTPSEAATLRGIMQNSVVPPQDEEPDSFNVRKVIFDELNKVGVK